jgi:hypothetical protein
VQAKTCDALTVILIRFVNAEGGRPSAANGELIAYETVRHDGLPVVTTTRRPGESEEELLQRAKATAPLTGSVLVLQEMRVRKDGR